MPVSRGGGTFYPRKRGTLSDKKDNEKKETKNERKEGKRDENFVTKIMCKGFFSSN